MSWYSLESLDDDTSEEWDLRSGISNWTWRTVSELKEAKEDAKEEGSRQLMSVDILPWVTPTLSHFIPPYFPTRDGFWSQDASFYGKLVQSDFEALEETCTFLEGTCLDVEDFRLALARGYCFPAEHAGIPCFKTMVEFIEHGSYPPTWNHPSLTPEDRARKQKTFDICKAALIKTVVEVAGEEKNEDVLWDDSVEGRPGGEFVHTMASWIKSYVTSMDEGLSADHRDDLVICASLTLGNLARREATSTALLSPPLSLAPYLASPRIMSPSTDIKLKHGILGLLKHLAQSATLSPVISDALAKAGVVQRVAESGIWDEGIDRMAMTVQLNAIGVVKHLCNATLTHTLALALPPAGAGADYLTGLERILALAERSDQVPIKSEGIRVLVNVIRTLMMKTPTSPTQPGGDELESLRKLAVFKVVTRRHAEALSLFLARSGKFPILVNEAIVALNLLCMQQRGSDFVLDAITVPAPEGTMGESMSPSPLGSDASSPTSVSKPRPLVARHALEMITNVLRNTDNPANYPVEIRANICTFLIHLTRSSSAPFKLSGIQHAVRPTLEKIRAEPGGDLLSSAVGKVLDLWKLE